MHETGTNGGPTRRRIVAVLAVVAVVALAFGVAPSGAEHGGPHPHLDTLARGAFTDQVDAQIRLKLDGQRTRVMNVRDASDIVVAEIAVPDGARFPWHTHPGPVLVTVTGEGTLTYVNADDCVLRHYGGGTAFVDPGQGNVHTAFNDSGHDVVLYATFLDISNGLTTPVAAPADCDPFPS